MTASGPRPSSGVPYAGVGSKLLEERLPSRAVHVREPPKLGHRSSAGRAHTTIAASPLNPAFTLRCSPSRTIRPSRGFQSRLGYVRPSSGSSPSIEGFQMLGQAEPDPRVSASCRATGPSGSSVALSTASLTAAFHERSPLGEGGTWNCCQPVGAVTGTAGSSRTMDRAFRPFVPQTETTRSGSSRAIGKR